MTSTNLPAKEVYEQYCGLWSIERAFGITKGTLEMRPMFHFTPRRIEAHVCICFVAYKIYKEIERLQKINQINLSVGKVLDIAKTITAIKINLPVSVNTLTKTMLLTTRHRAIAILFDENFGKNSRVSQCRSQEEGVPTIFHTYSHGCTSFYKGFH